MITLFDYYMGRDLKYPDELTDELRKNAEVTVARVNALLSHFKQSRKVVSGWRPHIVNAATPGAAIFSKHLTCEACDLADPQGDLDEWCMDHPEILEELRLWQEHPSASKGWAHLQIVPYKSWIPGKRRWFYP